MEISLFSKLTNRGGAYTPKIISGGTVGATIPSLAASYARQGNIVFVTVLFWGTVIPGASSDVLIIDLPYTASNKALRYYGMCGYNNTGKTSPYCLINTQSSQGNRLSFAYRNSSNGNEIVFSGSELSEKTIQFNISYITEES